MGFLVLPNETELLKYGWYLELWKLICLCHILIWFCKMSFYRYKGAKFWTKSLTKQIAQCAPTFMHVCFFAHFSFLLMWKLNNVLYCMSSPSTAHAYSHVHNFWKTHVGKNFLVRRKILCNLFFAGLAMQCSNYLNSKDLR